VHRVPHFGSSVGRWKLALLIACLTSLSTAPCVGQKPPGTSPPKYDATTEAKIKGVVEELKLPPNENAKDVAHLMVKNDSGVIDVYLCPKSFLTDMGIEFNKGDEISLTGSKVKHDEADLILAREVVKGSDTLVLRDDKGNPVWNWHR